MIRIGGVQMGPCGNTVQYNASRIADYIEDAAEANVDILCFPELCFTSYFPKRIDSLPELFFTNADPVLNAIKNISKKKELAIILPYAERDNGKQYNTAAVFYQGEILGKYRKVHIPPFVETSDYVNYESIHFQAGNLGFPIFNIKGINVGIQICFDRHFPEGFRALASKGVDVIFLPTNSASFGTGSRLELWSKLLEIRAYENEVYLMAVNKCGVEDGWEFMGNSMLVSPKGEVLYRLDNSYDGVFYYDIDLSKDIAKKRNFIKLRHPKMYQDLIRD